MLQAEGHSAPLVPYLQQQLSHFCKLSLQLQQTKPTSRELQPRQDSYVAGSRAQHFSQRL